MTGFFVSELNQRRRLLAEHLGSEEQMRRAEQGRAILIETSPLAILTLDPAGPRAAGQRIRARVAGLRGGATCRASRSSLTCRSCARMLHSHHSGNNMRTNVECKGQRRNGEVFLAHVWLSTYRDSDGPGLAAVVWDATENLRDREGAGLDSMMATSRVLIGAISHEIRNLASAAAAAHAAPGAGRSAGPERAVPGARHADPRPGKDRVVGPARGLRSRGRGRRSGHRARRDPHRDRARAARGRHHVVWEVSRGLPLVQADHHSLLQVFVNLARNSLQALEDAPRREVRISAAVESDLVVVRFRDTGPGVAHPDELFRPFQPGAHSFGLGLYISRAILRSHGGGLRYEPQARGSCFTVEFWPVENPLEGMTETETAQHSIRVLLVDDHALFRESVAPGAGGRCRPRASNTAPAFAKRCTLLAAAAVRSGAAGSRPGRGARLAIPAGGAAERIRGPRSGGHGVGQRHRGPPADAPGRRRHFPEAGAARRTGRRASAPWRRAAPGWTARSRASARTRATPQAAAPVFNDRQRKVLRFVLEGLSNKEIAWRLQISESYVKAILQSLFQKTGVRTRGQLVRWRSSSTKTSCKHDAQY